MTPASFFALLLPLGLGGFDPAPALIAAVFLSSGAETALASCRGVLLFGLVLIGGTALWGLTLTSLVGASIAQIPWAEVVHAFLYAGVWTALGKGALALGLVAFGVLQTPLKTRRRHQGTRLLGTLAGSPGIRGNCDSRPGGTPLPKSWCTPIFFRAYRRQQLPSGY